MDTILQLRGVSKRFGKKTVLNDVDLDVKSGEIFGIIGMSGAGKTTLLETLIGFIKPEKGTIMFQPRVAKTVLPEQVSLVSITKQPKIVKTMFGFATQEPSFYEKLTIEENMKYFSSLYNLPKEAIANNINSILDFVDLADEKHSLAGELSGGMQKRLDVACSLLNDPAILILDEPTADLDPVSRKHIWALIKKINEKGTTILISSHFLDEMDALCDRIALIHDKTIVHRGTADELRVEYDKNVEIHLETESADYDNIIKKLKDFHASKIRKEGSKLIMFAKDSESVLHKLLHIIEDEKEVLVDVDVRKPSLDEVFESMVNKKK
ncbi:ABC transporter ATP-binding protein [Nanoarchaeota archaeon]